ncbi:hypothetical protein VKT23_008473 [Stygiomarasmius scandens]|uniref:Uncharacterized protein n=1 Tax=Marasmiellus scandens TaxID=2682957 RepID=A0ABR1JJ30_9AGAR
MLSYKLLSLLAVGATFIASAYAETHTIIFDNRCGFGTPTLVLGPNVLSTGQALTINGPLVNAIAYLQTGSCELDGEGCTTVEITLSNPTSSVEISSS